MSSQLVNQCMRRRFVLYFLVQTVLWMLFLSASDILPKEGELIPRGGVWRPTPTACCRFCGSHFAGTWGH